MMTRQDDNPAQLGPISAFRPLAEVDGAGHARRRGADKRRDRALTALGWRVLRLDAALVMSDLSAAVALVQQALA